MAAEIEVRDTNSIFKGICTKLFCGTGPDHSPSSVRPVGHECFSRTGRRLNQALSVFNLDVMLKSVIIFDLKSSLGKNS
jgi:hypothetical protein